MRPVTLAGDDVVDPVAVDIRDVDGMNLRERHAIGAVGRLLADDEPALKGPLAILANPGPVPGQAPAMGREARDHVAEAVAIDVPHEHLRAAGACERNRMPLPQRIVRERLRLPPPAAFLEKIRPAVAVDIADAQTVGELRRADIGRDPVKCPALLGRVLWNGRIPERPAHRADDLRPSIAGEVDECR